jgi:hypothetical protein
VRAARLRAGPRQALAAERLHADHRTDERRVIDYLLSPLERRVSEATEGKMTFIADNDALRTYDPERGYELFKLGGGSGGDLRFKINGPEGSVTFWAERRSRSMTEEEAARHPQSRHKKVGIWRVSVVLDEDSPWRRIIDEAMTAYQFVHGGTIDASPWETDI